MHHSFGSGQTDGVLAEVVDRVVAAEESISKNDEGSSGRGDVHALEGGNTVSRYLEDVVASGQAVLGTSKVECDVGERADLVALNGVLATETLLGANLLVQELSKVRGENVQRSTSVEDSTSALELGSLVTERNRFDINLPVGLAAERDVLDLALVVVLVDTTENSLATLVITAEVESKDGLVNELLVDHLVERRDNLVDGDGIVAETQDTVEAAEGEGQTGLTSGLSKVLSLDLEVTDGEVIIGDETGQTATAVVDLKVRSVLLVGRRGGGVVGGVQEASNAVARLGGNPEVGASSVENDLEGLGRVADGDLGEVWQVRVSGLFTCMQL